MSQRSAHEHMQVFQKFRLMLSAQRPGAERTELPNFTVLRELAKDATPEVAVEKVLNDPEGWTKKTVKEQNKADREDLGETPKKKAITMFYDDARLYLARGPKPEAIRACHDFLAIYDNGGSTVVSKDKVKEEFKKLSQMAHPDKGGSTELMMAVNQAKKELLE